MQSISISSKLLFLDACCLINLFATGRIEEILHVLPYRFATSRFVATKEVLTIARADQGGEPIEREVISLAQLEGSGILSFSDLSTDQEMEDFVRFAEELDDGEASVCTLALSHRGGIATDDRKTLRVLARMVPRVDVVQTTELLYEWAQLSKASDRSISDVLQAIRIRGRFHPRRDAPRFDWWVGHL
jgi:predicted nucleic acid-binding protein